MICLRIGDQYHQALAAITAAGAFDLRRDLFVQLVHHAVDLLRIVFLHKIAEPVVLLLFACRKSSDPGQVGLDMCEGRFDRAKLSFLAD